MATHWHQTATAYAETEPPSPDAGEIEEGEGAASMTLPVMHHYTRIVRGGESVGEPVQAVLRIKYPPYWLADVEAEWSAARVAARLEHSHWDWTRKQLEDLTLVSLEAECRVQGLMAVASRPMKPPRRRIGGWKQQPRSCLYVEYIETAPWNLRGEQPPRYIGVGTALMLHAVRLSLRIGCDGRVGLHSLPQAERFYRERCHMGDFGLDPGYDNLRYFQPTPERAQPWLAEEGVDDAER